MTRSHLICSVCLLVTAAALGCDPSMRTESDQVAVDADLSFLTRTAFPIGVLEGSTACFTFEGYRSDDDDDDATVTDLGEAEMRACYDQELVGPAGFDEEDCVLFEGTGAVRLEMTRVPCGAGPEGLFGDDALAFDVIDASDAQAVFDVAIPVEAYLEGAEIEVEGLEAFSTPAGIVAAPGDPVRVIEGGLAEMKVALMDAGRRRLIATSEAEAVATVAEGSTGTPELGGLAERVTFSGTAGDAIDVALDTAGGRFDVGEIRLVSADAVATLSAHPQVVRHAGTDGFLALGALAVTRDSSGRILRGPAVGWEVVEGDYDIWASGAGEDAKNRGEGPRVELSSPCEGATAATAERTAVLEAHLGELRETVRVDWTCVDVQDDGCGCSSAEDGRGREGGRLLGLLVVVAALRPRRRGRLRAAR